MSVRLIYTVVALSCLLLPAFALQESKPEVKSTDADTQDRAEKHKQLTNINKVQDETRKREMLEKYLRENPDGPHLGMAYNFLVGTLLNVDPAKVIELADEILAKPQDSKNPELHRNAYSFKFRAYQKQKNEEAIRVLGEQILETKSDPSLLHEAAEYHKEKALQYYEKAIAEKTKAKSDDSFPNLSHLYVDCANELSRLGRKEQALEVVSKATELTQKELTELEALPDKDPKRRGIASLRSELSSHYQTMARMASEAGAEKGLQYLSQAEELLSEAALERRSSIEESRGRLYEVMGKNEDALGSYTRSFAFRMDVKTRDKIKELAEKSGKPAADYFIQARQLREARAQLFKPFELKTVEGETQSFADLRGKVTLVNFFFPT